MDLAFVSRPSEDHQNVMDIFVFPNDVGLPLQYFWSLEKSHVHLSYITITLPESKKKVSRIRKPAALTLRAPGGSPWKAPADVITIMPDSGFQTTMRVGVPGGGTEWTWLVQYIRTQEAAPTVVRDAYNNLTAAQVTALGLQWDSVLAAVQDMMNEIYGPDKWSIGRF